MRTPVNCCSALLIALLPSSECNDVDESPNLSQSLSHEPPKPLSRASPSKRNLLGRLAPPPPGRRSSTISLLESEPDLNAWVDIPGAESPGRGSYGQLQLDGRHHAPTTLAELNIDEEIRRRAAILVQQHVVSEAEAVSICKTNPGLSDYHTSLQLTWLEARHQVGPVTIYNPCSSPSLLLTVLNSCCFMLLPQVAGTILRSVRWWAAPSEVLAVLEQALQVCCRTQD